MEIARKIRSLDFSYAAKAGIIGIFAIEFFVGLLIIQANSSTISIVITVPRMIASFFSMIFMLLIMRRQRCVNNWKQAVKVIATVCIVFRLLSIIGLKYIEGNPSPDCYINTQTFNSLVLMDILSGFTIVTLTVHTFRAD